MTQRATEFNRYCKACRQSLRGVVSRRCPECGGAFDPDDPRTTNAHPWPGFWDGLASVARVVTILLVAYAAVCIVVSGLGCFNPLWLFLPALAALHLMLFIVFAAVTPALPLTWRWRMSSLVAVAIVVSVLFTHWPLRISFALHRPWLEPIADRVQVEGTSYSPRWVGVYRFQRIIRNDRGNVGFKLSGRPGNGIHLVRQHPDAQHVWYNSGTMANLGGGWYVVDED